jgi:hypothetical protein
LDVSEPLLSLLLVFRPLLIDFLERWLLLPLPQQPLGRAVKTGIGIRAIQLEQLEQCAVALRNRELVGFSFTQAQEQRPAYRNFLLHI